MNDSDLDDGAMPPAPEPELVTRAPMVLWDRIKFLLLLAIVWLALVFAARSQNPLESFVTAARLTMHTKWWLTTLFGIELLRQANYLLAEKSESWNIFWTESIVEPASKIGADWNDWTRFRVSRVLKIVLVLSLLAIVLAAYYHTSPFTSLFQAPAALYSSLPLLAQLAFAFVFVLLQFVGLFWFLSKGGIDVYFPGDIKTRFTDVWGQDSVLDRVKENIIFLKDPEAIEEKGGYVPGGILLWGPPGTGKTLIAEAVAGETQNPYVFVDPGAFINMFMGVGVLKVKSLFRKLRKLSLRYGGVVVFFDEADSLGSRGALAPQGTFGFADNRFSMSYACNGMSYLSDAALRSLLLGKDTSASDEAPQSNRRSRVIAGMGGLNGGGGGGTGTLQALLTELSGLKKPRGFFNRVVRRAFGLRPKSPPKYRILVMMATNLPQALDEALLRPGRIDRIYRVGYPSKAGRIRTYMGYLDKVSHNLTADEVDRLATITPYATGATMKDLVNEALITAIRDGRDVITWRDIIMAKQLKELGPPEDVEYIERERHAVAIHEACHAVMAATVRHHLTIDIATIEKGSNYLGMVASIPPEDQFTHWRSEYEADIMVALASLAGERMFFMGDNSSGVSADLEGATVLATLMEGYWGMGSTISSHGVTQSAGIGAGTKQGRPAGPKELPRSIADRIEARLDTIFRDTIKALEENRVGVLSVAHALESTKTLTGEDVLAILNKSQGPLVDGTIYNDPDFIARLEKYHTIVAEAHRSHKAIVGEFPSADGAFRVIDVIDATSDASAAMVEQGR